MKQIRFIVIFIISINVPLISQTLFYSEEGGVIKSKDLSTGEEKILFDDQIFNQISNIHLDKENERVFFNVPSQFTSAEDTYVVGYDGSQLTHLGQFANFGTDFLYYDNDLDLLFMQVTSSGDSQVLSIDANGYVEYIQYWDNNQDGEYLSYNAFEKKFYFMAGDSLQVMDADGTNVDQLLYLPNFTTGVNIFDPYYKEAYWSAFDFFVGQSYLIKSSVFNWVPDTILVSSPAIDTVGYFSIPVIDHLNDQLYTILSNTLIFGGQQRILYRANLDGSELTALDEVLTSSNDLLPIDDWDIDVDYGNRDYAIQHFNYLPDHPDFDNYRFLNSAVVNPNQFQEFKICADGSDASVFKVKFPKDAEEPDDFILRIKEDPNGNNPEIYGTFSSLPPDIPEAININYEHPKYLVSEAQGEYIHLELFQLSSQEVKMRVPIKLFNPPTILVHGLGSDQSTFLDLEKSLIDAEYPEELILIADYKPTNDYPFVNNGFVVPINIIDAIDEALIQGYATGKVNLIGHSMGGILARLYLQSSDYNDDINKLITLNTPHSGSQVTNRLLDVNVAPSIRLEFCKLLFLANLVGDVGFDCGGGAIADLRVNSDAILNNLNGANLNANTVPSHVVVTIKNPNDAIMKMIAAGLGVQLTNLFNGDQSDMVVAQLSQAAGLDAPIAMFYNDISHTEVTNSPEVFPHLIDVLFADPEGLLFTQSGFNPPTLTYDLSGGMGNEIIIASTEISSSFENQTINYGDEIDIQVESANLDNTILLYEGGNLMNNTGHESFESGSVAINRSITPSSLGSMMITALSYASAGNEIARDTFSLVVGTNEAPQAIWENSGVLALGQPSKLSIKANFSSFSANVAGAPGVIYDFKNAMATYLGNGLVMPLTAGLDTLSITLNGVTSPPFRVKIEESVISSTFEQNSPLLFPSNGIKAFPNPIENVLYLSTNYSESSVGQISIKDLSGRTLFEVQSVTLRPSHAEPIDLSALSAGVYFLSFSNEAGRETLKFVKQ